MSKKARSNILLLITSVVWGCAFVAQKAGTVLEPFTYNGLRLIVGCISLIPAVIVFSGLGQKNKPVSDSSAQALERKNLLKGGVVCGLLLGCATNLQQFGMYLDTDAGKAGFITTLYIILVPVLGIFFHKKVGVRMWLCVLVGAVGFYFLTMAGKGNGFTLEKGDFLILICAGIFSLHILAIDHFSPKCDGIKLSCIQFFIGGTISLVLMFLTESPKINAILDCWFPIIYAGVMSSGLGYTLQIIAQRDADPTTASLIMSLESVFAVLAGVLLFGERLTSLELLGCVAIFAAVIISQLPSKHDKVTL